MKNKEFKIIEKVFYNYKKMMESAVTSTVDLAEKGVIADYMKLPVQSSNRGARENKLCEIIDKQLIEIRWCYVVEKTLDHYCFEQDKKKFINMHYFNHKCDIETCLEVGISRRTFYGWRNEILSIAYKWAVELKLLKENKNG